MSITLNVLDANANLTDHENTIRQFEELAFRLISISIGRESGNKGNLVTFSDEDVGGLKPIKLKIISSDQNRIDQEAQLNEPGQVLVCYGSLYVQGKQQNIAAFREAA